MTPVKNRDETVLKRYFWAALLLSTAPAAFAAGEALPDPHALLAQALAEPQVSYSARVMLTQWFGKRTKAEEADVYFSPPNKYRWEFLSPRGGISRVVVSDGEDEFVWLPRRNQVLGGSAAKSGSKLITPKEELALLTKNYAISVAGAEEVAGRDAWRLEITPGERGKPAQELWVDRETSVILQNRRTGTGGMRTALSRFVRFDPVKRWPEEVFRLKTSSATQSLEHALDPDFLSLDQIRQETGQAFDVPTELPGGFVFESADHYTKGKTTVYHLRYTDGLAILSLFETGRAVRSPWGPREFSSGKVLQWNVGHRHFTLVGDVSDDLLTRIAGQLRSARR
jgi:outer membrane lipoprotein-sorting protein